MSHIECLSYVCTVLHELADRLAIYGTAFPGGTLQTWLQHVYDEAME